MVVRDHLGGRLVHRHFGERLDGHEAVPPPLQLGGRIDRTLGIWVALDELLDGTAKVGAGFQDFERDLAEAEALERVVRSHFVPARAVPRRRVPQSRACILQERLG